MTASTARPNPRLRALRTRRVRTLRQRIAYGLLGFVVVIAGWQLLVKSGSVDPVFLSSPHDVWDTLVQLMQQHDTYMNLWVTFKEWCFGFLLAVGAGVVIGVASGWSKWVGYVAQPWLNVMYAVPELALIPIFIMWFGIGLEFKVWVAFIAGVFVVAINTIAGVHATDVRYLNVANTYGAGRLRTMRTVVLPGAVPFVMTGIRQASGRALVGVVAAEFLSANQGLGFFISLSGQTLNTRSVLAGIVILAVFGVIIGVAFRAIESRFDVWRRPGA